MRGRKTNNAVGVKGRSGRKSFKEEKANYEALKEMFYEPMDIEELKKKIKTGRFSVKDRIQLKALMGISADEKMFQKIFPDLFKGDMKIETEDIERARKDLQLMIKRNGRKLNAKSGD